MVAVNISLPDQLKQYVDTRLNEGGYNDTSAFIHDLISADQKRRAQERLEMLLQEGLDSGEPIELTDETVQQMRRELIERISKDTASGN